MLFRPQYLSIKSLSAIHHLIVVKRLLGVLADVGEGKEA